MGGAADVGVYTAALFELTAFVASALRLELEMGTLVSSMTAVSVVSAGLLVALAVQVALAVPFVWPIAVLAALTVVFVLLYELFV